MAEFVHNLIGSLKADYEEAQRRGESLEAFADRYGITRSTLKSWFSRPSSQGPTLSQLEKIADKIGNSALWKMFTGSEPPSKITPPGLVVQHVPRFKKFAREFHAESYIPVRLLHDAAAAGSPAEINENDIESWALIYASKEWMPNNPENYTCVYVRGKSMSPILDNGDIVAIDHAEKDPKRLDGKMTAFRVNGGVTIKWCKFFEERAQVIGIPENKDEFDHAVSLSGEEIDHGIVGMVRWWWAKR